MDNRKKAHDPRLRRHVVVAGLAVALLITPGAFAGHLDTSPAILSLRTNPRIPDQTAIRGMTERSSLGLDDIPVGVSGWNTGNALGTESEVNAVRAEATGDAIGMDSQVAAIHATARRPGTAVSSAPPPGSPASPAHCRCGVEPLDALPLLRYSARPNALISASSCGESSRGTSPRATFSALTLRRISSTTSGFARVLVSPTSVKLEIPAMTLRMILPERVFGMSGTIQTFFGRAILPIWVSIARATFSSKSAGGASPGLSDT